MFFNYTTEYHENTNILIFNTYGTLCLDSFYKSWTEILSTGLIPEESLNILIDNRKIAMKISVEDINRIADFYKKHKILKNKKMAVVLNDPDKVVFPLLLDNKVEFDLKTFSTLDGAYNWLESFSNKIF